MVWLDRRPPSFGEEMTRRARIGLISLALAGVYLLLNGIGWAAVLFWKSEFIVWCVAVPSFVLCPLSVIEVVPGCSLDTPLFFIPMMGVCFILWALGIEAIWRKRKRMPNRASPGAARQPAEPEG